MSLYKYVTTDVLMKIINGSIRFTQPGAFNDPFEMLPELHMPEPYKGKGLNIEFDILNPRRNPPVGELPIGFESNSCNDANSRRVLASLNKSIGILCLSKNPDSLLMWSHYADEYSGCVIEVDDKHDFFQGQIDMDYKENRPKKDISAYLSDKQPVPIAELCVKPKEWEYENEVRIIRKLSDCRMVSDSDNFPIFIMDIPHKCIKSITIGERTSVKKQREIWNLVKNTQIILSLAAISSWGYKFRSEIIKYNVSVSEMSPQISPRTAHIFTDIKGEFGELARWMVKNHKMSEIVNDTV